MKILIGYDGSECAQSALNDLAGAGLPETVTALVLGVAEIWLPPPSGYEFAAAAGMTGALAAPRYSQEVRLLHAAEELAREGADCVQKVFPAWQIDSQAAQGSPAWALISKADSWQPDLIVVGSHGRSVLGRLFLGSVSQKVLSEAHCSVRIARGTDYQRHGAPRLLIGHDGSPAAACAVQTVAARQWPAGTQARVVAVQDLYYHGVVARFMGPVGDWLEEADQSGREWAQQVVTQAAAQLSALGLATQAEVVSGDPKHKLVEEAANWGATSVFLGATGYGRVERFLLGSVAGAVAARAHCSVEIVRPARNDE